MIPDGEIIIYIFTSFIHDLYMIETNILDTFFIFIYAKKYMIYHREI